MVDPPTAAAALFPVLLLLCAWLAPMAVIVRCNLGIVRSSADNDEELVRSAGNRKCSKI